MRRRSIAGGGKAAKTRRRKTVTLKRRNAAKTPRQSGSSAASSETEVARLRRERDEALEQQRAAAEVLKIISASRTELQPVLEVVVRSAARYCKADDVTLFELDGQELREAAHWGAVPHLEGLRFPCTRGTVAGRLFLERKPVHVIDIQAEAKDFPEGSALAKRFGHRTIAGVPLLREGVAVGTLQIRRTEVNPFTDKQIELLQNFASQAVIAIENARLLNELRQRTEDLSESLEQQTATSEVLKVIAGSQGKLELVFTAMLENATRICGTKFGVLYLCEGQDTVRAVAMHGAPQPYLEERRRNPVIRPAPATTLGRVLGNKQTVQNADVRNDARYLDLPSGYSDSLLGKLAGARTILAVPMLKNEVLIGAFGIYRQEVRPFTEKQIALLQNFAAQAVIAIENTRLLNELRQRTTDLSESLEQQTATSEVLNVISSSPGELEPVFQTILEKAVRICDANFGILFRFDGDNFHPAAQFNTPTALLEAQARRGPFKPTPGISLDRVMRTKKAFHSADMAAEPVPGLSTKLGGARSQVTVPMLKDDALIGAIVIYRQEVRPFSEKQIGLVQNFAAQAVIAIENARLLSELHESLDQQTATADVLRIISSSPGELKPVFNSILENATRICQANFGFLHLYEDGKFQTGAARYNMPPAFADDVAKRGPLQPGPLHPLVRVAATKQLLHILNYAEDPAYKRHDPLAVRLVELAGARTLVEVPMLKEGELIGAIAIYRQEVRPFTDKQIELVQNFAAQAVIAIENARLLNELRQRTDDLSEALEQQTATSEVLRVISSSPGDLE